MSNLTMVLLEDNLFTGTLSTSFLRTHNRLRYLDLSGNMLEGFVPAHFFTLESLEILDLHGNQLSGELGEFAQNTVMTHLGLHENNIGGPIPTSIVSLRALEHLDLSQNEFTGQMPEAVGLMWRLSYLFLAENDPVEVDKCSEIHSIDPLNSNFYNFL